MGGFASIASGIGGIGRDLAGGAGILQEQRQKQAQEQLRQLMMKLQWQELQARINQQTQEAQRKTPEGTKAYLKGVLGRDPTEEELQRYVGVQPPAQKSKYSNFRVDDKGQLRGYNVEANREEVIPGSESTKFGKTPSPLGKIDPIIAAQVGKPPDPSQFPQGENDPTFKAKMKMWGAQAETIKNRMASAGAIARGQAYGAYRYGGYITPDGELVTATAKDAADRGYVPAAPGFQAMSKQAQFSEIGSASQKLKDAIGALQPGDAFTTAATAQLTLATRAQDTSMLNNAITNAAANSLNERQQDVVVWVGQMMERVLSIRSIAGMGQGAEDLRRAIQATVPSIISGNRELALKRLAAVDNQVAQLYRGIPKVSKITGSMPSSIPPPPAGAEIEP